MRPNNRVVVIIYAYQCRQKINLIVVESDALLELAKHLVTDLV